ncbi:MULTISPECIES: ATP-binding cassette domain-containing protein [Halomonas]|uniref:ATP-binding cassette domain-containing protein n=1 Tax=Halomonas TaxID=2745 RepID=UPI001FECD333|nr:MULTISPECIES: ABC transporter ATP-binding protein [Halomonas]MDR5890576.1 ABC transporter ATP-binding protein [Halomonas salina]WJY08228.1 ABC transporter ATP-binding protein [Halomonas halophila]
MTSPAYDPVLRVDDLRIRLGQRPVVEGLSFDVEAGERVCLIGPSGSGKSLTAGAILGLTPPAARIDGTIRLNGLEVGGLRATRRPALARAGMVFQNTQAALNPLVSVGAQLREPFLRFHGLSRREAQRAVVALLGRMMIAEPERVVRRSPAELSGGQRQRVCLALALACRPSLIVADEPTTALDVLTQAEVLSLLRETTGTADTPALLFISHDMAAASRLCERALVLDGGRLVEQGPLADIIAAPQHRFSRELVAALGNREFLPASAEPQRQMEEPRLRAVG